MKKPHRLACRICCALTASCLLTASPVLAIDKPDSGQVLRDVQQKERTLPQRIEVPIEVSEADTPPLSDTGLRVYVERFRITGQDVFPDALLQQLISPYTKKEQSLAGLQKAADVLRTYFRGKGYSLAKAYIPAQDINNGEVELVVVIGRVGEVNLRNKSSVKDAVLRQQMTALRPGDYVTLGKLERPALLLNDLPGLSAKMTLTPGKTTGTTDIIMDVKDNISPKNSTLTLNNWGNRFTGTWQAGLSTSFTRLSRRGDAAFLSLTHAGQGLTSGNLSYQIPLTEGGKLNIGYSQTQYELGEDFASLQSYGTAYTTHADFSYALHRSRKQNLSLQVGYDSKRLEDRTDSTEPDTVVNKRNRAYSFGLSGDINDTWAGGGTTAYNVTHYQGHLSGTSNGSDLNTGNWHKTAYSLMRQQFVADRLALLLSFSGQLAGTNLDSSERFSLGGATGVRAYPSGEASGDEAWLFSGELRWQLPSHIGKGAMQAGLFYDTGVSLKEKYPSAESANRRSISAYGANLMYTVPGEYYLKMAYARKAGSEAAKSDTDRTGRFWVQMGYFF